MRIEGTEEELRALASWVLRAAVLGEVHPEVEALRPGASIEIVRL